MADGGIDRRSFLVGTTATARTLTLSASGQFAVSLFATDLASAQLTPARINFYVGLKKAVDKATSFYAWIDWSSDAVPQLLNQQIPSAPPGICPTNNDLEGFRDAVAAITFTIPVPDINYSDLPKPTMRETRYALTVKYAQLASSTVLFDDAANAAREVQATIDDAQRRGLAIDILADGFELLAHLPLPTLHAQAVSCFGAIELNYKPLFLSLVNELEDLGRRVTAEARAKSAALRALVNEHRNFLALEKVQIDVQSELQGKMQKDIDRVGAELTEVAQEMARTEARIDEMRIREQAYESDIQNLTDQNAQHQAERNSLNAAIVQDQNFLNASYSYCPDGNPWDNCRSEAHRPYRDRWIQDQNSARARRDGNRNRVNLLAQAISENTGLISRFRTELASLRTELTATRDALAGLNTKREALRRDLTEKRAKLDNEKLINPVDFITNQNLQEQRSLDLLVLPP